MKKQSKFFLMTFSLFLGLSSAVSAATVKSEVKPASKAPVKAEVKPVSKIKMNPVKAKGVVSARNFSGLALEYKTENKGTSSLELWLPFGEKMKFGGGYKSKKDIGEGDRIEVIYMDAEDHSGKYIDQIRLLAKAPKEDELVSKE